MPTDIIIPGVPSNALPLATAVSPGAMSAAQAAAVIFDETLTSVGAGVAGDVVRRVSAGVWTPAQADTPAHYAGVLGIYDGTTVRPIYGQLPRVNFVAAPTVGSGAWLSAATAGKLACVAPLALIPQLGIVFANLSVGAAYAGSVNTWQQQAANMTLKDSLLFDTISRLGGSAGSWTDVFDDFGQLASDWKSPRWGVVDYGTIGQSIQSNIFVPLGCVWEDNTPRLSSSVLTAVPWRFSARFRAMSAGAWFTGITNNSSFGFGTTAENGLDNTHLMFFASSHRFAYGSVVAADRVDLGVLDQNYHIVDMLCDGAGLVYWQLDGGGYSAPITLVVDGGSTATLVGVQNPYCTSGVYLDWLFFASKHV